MMRPASFLSRVENSNCCAGCGLCASLAPDAISVAMDEKGFIRPKQTSEISVSMDTTIAQVCPGITIDGSASGKNQNLLWGPIIGSRTGHANDDALRKHASSGGVISALATYLVKSGAVQGVIQVTASSASPIDNATVRNVTPSEIFDAAGSRYAPSAPLAKISDHLNAPGPLAFVGKPCDVAALRALARVDARVDSKFPYMISFFCAGIPSRNATLKIVNQLGLQEEDLASFRYRGDGWPGFATAVTKDGQSARMSYADSWGDILSKQVQFRCKICPDGSGGQADVVCADAWESDERGYPKFAETDGRSLILSRTPRGEDLVCRAISEKVIYTEVLDPDQIARMQPSQATRKKQVLSRLMAMNLRGYRTPGYSGLNLKKAAMAAGLAGNLRGFWGTFRRLKPARKVR